MPLFTSPDGRYVFAMQTQGEGDGNSVVYDRGVPVWDRFSHEAGESRPSPPRVPPSTVRPGVPEGGPVPSPAVGGGWVIPVTSEQDSGPYAPRMMSDRANAWVQGNTAYVFAGSVRTGGPQFFAVDLGSGHVTPLGAMIPYVGETEGWYWAPDGHVMVLDGPRLRRVSPFSGSDEIVLDIGPGYDLWQPHSSDDGQTHSATKRQIVDDGAYPKVGTVVVRQGKVIPFPAQGVLDESQITRNGRWVVIKEDRGGGDDNRIIDLETRETTWLPDRGRAMGHSDCGPDFIVGEADKPDPGMCGWWDLRVPLTPERFHPLFPSLNVGYLSARGGRVLWSSDTHLSLVDRQTGQVTPIHAHGGGSSYDDRVKANLSPCGRVAPFMVGGAVKLLVLT